MGDALNLREENEMLREEVRQLRQRLGLLATDDPKILSMRQVFGVTRQRALLLAALLAVPVGRREHLLEAMSAGWSRDPDIKLVDVVICKLRRELEPFDLFIETVWGDGYRLAPDMKARMRVLLKLEETEDAAA